jgi:HTH-type transcriptional regulator / antitoxin MqsA
MAICNVCSGQEFRLENVTEVFVIDGKRVLVEGIPARICANCGDLTFGREVTEKVRRMVHGGAKPVGTIEMEVFAFA